MKWISEKTLKDCQIFRYSPMENGKEGNIPLVFDEPSKRIAESEGDLRFVLGWEKRPEEYEQIDFTDMEDIEF